MRKTFYVLFLLIMGITSCKKDDDIVISVKDMGEKISVTASNVPFESYVVGFRIAPADHPKLSFPQYCPNNKNIPELVAWKTTLLPDTGTYIVTGIVKEYDKKANDFISEIQGDQIKIKIE